MLRRPEVILLLLVLGFGGFIAYQAVGKHAPTPRPVAAAPAAAASGEGGGGAGGGNEVVVGASLPAPVRDVAAERQLLHDRAGGTYIDEILAARDSNVARWPDRRANPVTVWIDEASPLATPERGMPSQVRRAFSDWGAAGVPLAFNFIADSAKADVKVTFVDRFNERISGRTVWRRDPNSWIVGGDIQLSLRDRDLRLLTQEQFYAISLHEVGHLLGLDHTADTTAIMAARVRVLTLAPQDVATMRLIYEVQPGSVKAAAR